MGYKGAYDQAKSGREAYMETYSTGANAKTYDASSARAKGKL